MIIAGFGGQDAMCPEVHLLGNLKPGTRVRRNDGIVATVIGNVQTDSAGFVTIVGWKDGEPVSASRVCTGPMIMRADEDAELFNRVKKYAFIDWWTTELYVEIVPSGPAKCQKCGLLNEYSDAGDQYVCYECRT